MQAKKAHQLLLWGRGEETKRNSIKFEGWIIHYFRLIPLSLMIIRNWPIPDAFSRKHWELTLLQKYPYFRPSLLKSIPNFRQRGSNLPMGKKRYSHWESILWKIPRVINWKLLTLSSPSQGYWELVQGILPFMVSLNQTNMSSNKLSPIHRNKTSLIKACLTKAIIKSWKAKVGCLSLHEV